MIQVHLANCPLVAPVTQMFNLVVVDECLGAILLPTNPIQTTVNYVAGSGPLMIPFMPFATDVTYLYANSAACGQRTYSFLETNLPFANIVAPPSGSEFDQMWNIEIDATLAEVGTYTMTLQGLLTSYGISASTTLILNIQHPCTISHLLAASAAPPTISKQIQLGT